MPITLLKPFNLDTTKDYTFANITGTGNVVANNATLGNLATANYFSGNGSLLTGIVASTATTAGTVTTNAQPNITSVGTLNGVTITGTANFIGSSNIALGTVSNLYISGGTSGYVLSTDGSGTLSWVAQTTSSSYGNSNVAAYLPTYTGNVSANYFIGNGSTLTNITGSNVSGNVTSAIQSHYANIANSVAGSNISGQVGNALVAGTVYTNAQPNITSVGTLASLTVTGNITSGNASLGNLASATYFSGDGSLLTGITGTYSNSNVASYLPTYTGNFTAGNANVTGTMIVASITTSGSAGNITGANYINANFYIGNGSLLTGLPASYSNANVAAYLPTYTGNVAGNYFIGNGSLLTGLPSSYSNANVAAYLPTYTGNFTAGNANISGNIIAGNLTTSGSGGNLSGANYVISNYFSGNGSLLTSITGANVSGNVTSAVQSHFANIANSVAGSNVSGQVGNALVAGTVYTNAQPNITSVGTLVSLSVTGNVTSGNASLGNLASATYFSGNGSLLTSITGANVTGTVANATYATSAGSATSATTAGTVTTNAQPNITSLGTLAGLTGTGVFDLTGTSNVALGAVGNVHITGGTAGYVLSTDGSGTLSWVAQSGGGGSYANSNVAAYLPTYTGNISANYVISNYFSGNGSLLTYVTGSNVSGNVASAIQSHYANIANSVAGSNVDGQVGNALVAGTVYTNAQPNITSVGTLASLDVTANITSGNASLGNLATATYFSGNGSLLTSITGANVSLVDNAKYVTEGTQGNITSIGTLNGLTSGAVVDFTTTSNVSLGTVSNLHITGGSAGFVLQTDGSGGLSFVSAGSTGIAGTDKQVQFNDGGSFGASANFAFDKSTKILTVDKITANGAGLTSITGANVSGNVTSAVQSHYANIANSVAGSNVSGNVTSAVQSHYANIANSVAGSNVSGQVGNALVAGTVYTNAQPNITSLGTLVALSVTGNVDITGNINVTGNLNYSNVSDLVVGDPLIFIGANNTGNLYDLGFVASYDDGTATHTGFARDASDGVWKIFDDVIAEPTTTIDFANGTYAALKSGTFTSTGNISGLNANLGNLVVANYFSGDGSLLTGVAASSATTAGTVTTNAQPNITTVGTLISLSVTGNITSGNASLGNLASATYFSGDGSLLTSITGANVSGTVSNANYSTYAGTVITSAQPNITSVGTLASLTVTANITSGNASLGNLASATYFSGNGSLLTYITGSNVTGNVTSAVQSHYANIANSVAGSNVSGQVGNALVAGTVYTNAQPNITSLGTLAGLTSTGVINLTGTSNVALGVVGNVHITGGVDGQILTTDGTGNLQWVDNSPSTVTYLGNSIALTNGVYVTGDLYSIQVFGDYADPDGVYTLTDGTGAAPAWIFDVDYISVTNFNRVVMNINYTAASGHTIYVQLYNYDTSFTLSAATVTTTTGTNIVTVSSTTNMAVGQTIKFGTSVGGLTAGTAYYIISIPTSGQLTVGTGTGSGTTVTLSTDSQTSTVEIQNWDNIGTYTGLGSYYAFALQVIDDAAYISSGIVKLRLFHSNGGSASHTTNIDYLALELSTQGPQGPRGPTGATGATGNGVASGGTTGQVLIKNSGSNYDTAWSSSLTSLTSITATGNITSGNASLGNLATANYFSGNGSLLTYITGSNVNGNVTSAVQSHYANIANSVAGSNVSGQVGNALVAGTVYTNAQPNITSVGSLSGLTVSNATGVVDFTTTANVTLGAVANLHISGGTDGYVLKTNGSGTLTWVAQTSGGTPGGSDTQVQFNDGGSFGGNSAFTFNKTTGNVVITGNLVTGSGTGGNISGLNYVTANYLTGTLTTAVQPNITSVGTLASLTVTGNITSGNASLGNLATANYFSGNGILLTYITGSNVNGNVTSAVQSHFANIANSVAGSNVSGQVGNALVAGTVYTNAQPNITSVGTLVDTTLGASNSFSGGNLVSATYLSGTLTTGAQSNITSVGSLGSLTVTGLITATGTGIKTSNVQDSSGTVTIQTGYGSVSGAVGIYGNITAGTSGTGFFVGNGSYLSGLAGGNVSGQVGNALVAGTVYTNAQPNITSVGSLSGLTVSNATGVVNFTTTANVTLGSVSNLHISGGSANYVLQTDGSGTLSWAASGGGSPTITDNTSTNATYYPVYATASSGSLSTAGVSSTKLQFNPSLGQLTVTDLNSLSDATLKTNWQSIDDPFSILDKLFGMGFEWTDNGRKSYGLSAQNVESILPELVGTTAQGKKTVNYIPIIAFLLEALKKNNKELQEIKNSIKPKSQRTKKDK